MAAESSHVNDATAMAALAADPASNTNAGDSSSSAGGKSRIMDRLRERHINALAGFQERARGMSADIDAEITEFLRELRRHLSMDRSEWERTLDATKVMIGEHRAAIRESAEATAARKWGDAAVVLADPIHPAGEAFPTTLEKRQARLEAERRSVLELGLQLRRSHDARMGSLAEAEDFLHGVEARRRAQLKDSLEALLEELSSIAYVGTTVSQLLVHRAALSANQQLLDNDVAAKELLTKLRQHEVLKHRGYLKRVGELYGEKVAVLAESVALWSQQVLTTDHFRDPEARADTLVRVGRCLKQTKKDVANLINGVDILVKTLLRNPHGIGSTDVSEKPGGAVASGWLQHFDHDTDSMRVFSAGPEAISEQWRVSVGVILQQLRHENGRLLEALQASERLLREQAASILAFMNHDMQQLHIPSPQEVEVVHQCAHDDAGPAIGNPDVEARNPYPLHIIGPKPELAAAAQTSAAEGMNPDLEAIDQEAAWFNDMLALQLFVHGNSLVNTLTGSTGGLVPIIADATSTLHDVTTQAALRIRREFASHRDEFRDFQAGIFRFEQTYQLLEDHLAHAGTVENCQELCYKATGVLKQIEKLYGSHHTSRSNKLPAFHRELQSLFDDSMKRLRDDLYVVPLADIKARNAQLDAELQGLKERLRTPASKKGEKAVKPAEAQAQLAAAQEKHSHEYVDLTNASIITVRDGDVAIEYAALKPAATKYGGADRVATEEVKVVKQETATPMTAKELKAARAKEKKAATTKDKKGAAAADGAADGAGGGEDAMPALEPLGAHETYFYDIVRGRLEPLFHTECLVTTDAVRKIVQSVRAGMLQWIADYSTRCIGCASVFITDTKSKLDAETNECVRRHYRRAPTLQSQVYDIRVRELEDAMQSRGKHTEWLRHRVTAAMDHALSSIAATSEPVANDIIAIEDACAALPTLTSVPTVEASNRHVNATANRARGHVGKRLDDVITHTEHTLAVVRRDADTFKTERLRSFEEGGDVSASEKQAGLDALAAIVALADGTDTDMRSSVTNARETQESKIAAAMTAYTSAFEHNLDELRFFSSLGDVLSAAKARYSQQLAASNTAMNELEAVVAKLEQLLGSGATTLRKELRGKGRLDTLQWDTLASAASKDGSSADETPVSVDDEWTESDVALSNRLRSTHVHAEAELQSTKAVDIIGTLDTLRQQLYSRGLFLGALAYGCEFSPVPIDTYFTLPDPAKDGAQADAAAGKDAGKSGGGKGGKGQKTATPEPTGAEDTWSAFTRVPRWDTQLGKVMAPVKERSSDAMQYFTRRPGKLLRSEPYGADKDAVKATLDSRFAAIEQRFGETVAEQTKTYRTLVQKVHLLTHRAAQEVIASVVNHGIESVDERVTDCVAVLEAYLRSMARARERASSLLKGGMTAPSSQGRLRQVNKAERERQDKACALIVAMSGAVAREAQEESTRIGGRAAQALATVFTMLKTVVTPEHLVPGDEVVVGQHKGIKRLMRQRMREEAAKALDAAAAKDGGKDKAGGAKKPDPKKAGDQGGKGGAGAAKGGKAGGKGGADAGKDEVEYAVLQLLDRPMHEYAGIRINSLRAFDQWRREHPTVTIRDHYAAPAMWDAPAATPEVAPAPTKGGKAAGGAAAKAPAAASGKGGAKAAAADASAPTIPEAEPVVTGPLTAPQERLFQAGWLSRQQAFDSATTTISSTTEACGGRLGELLKGEEQWRASWGEAVNALLVAKS